jgi:LSD1 subclass zinc finger protein
MNLQGSIAIFLVLFIHFSMGHALDLHRFVALVVLQFIYPDNLMIADCAAASPGGRPLQLLPSATRVRCFNCNALIRTFDFLLYIRRTQGVGLCQF